MTVYIADTETDGLLDTVSRAWCGSVVSEDETYKELFTDLPSFLAKLDEASAIVFHNGFGFDIPMLKKLYGWEPKAKVIDTMTMSMLLFPNIEGGHSLEAWGHRLGFVKTEHNDWSKYTPEMGEYCLNDTVVGAKLYRHLKEEASKHDWKLALRIEHAIAKIVGEYAVTGWHFDVDAATKLVEMLGKEMELLEQDIAKVMPWRTIRGSEVSKPFKKNGEISKIAAAYGNVAGPFTRVSFEIPNIQSRQQLAEALIKSGWTPTEFTDKGAPKLGEEQLEALTGELGGKISKRFTMGKRRAMIETWLANVAARGDHRITCGAFSCGAASGRMTHRIVTSVPKGEAGIYLGKEIRQLFCAPDGYSIVGADAAGIQLRILAHYMNDPKYTEGLVSGKKELETDVHSLTAIAAGLKPKELYDIDGRQGTGRDVGKTIGYGLIFRAGNDKMGAVIGKGPKEGAALKKKLLSNMPKYQDLLDRVEAAFNSKGYLIGLDGRRIYAPDAFTSFNYLIQGGEAVAMKVAIARMLQLWYNRGYDAILLGVWHDETQSQVRNGQEELVGQSFNEALGFATRFLNLRCPLVGEYKVGSSWYNTH